jgi:hypothetical protein
MRETHDLGARSSARAPDRSSCATGANRPEAIVNRSTEERPGHGRVPDFARCRSCGVQILWARTEAGKAIPLDAEPLPSGLFVVTTPTDPRQPLNAVSWASWAGPRDRPRFTAHFATCPFAAKHRKPRKP